MPARPPNRIARETSLFLLLLLPQGFFGMVRMVGMVALVANVVRGRPRRRRMLMLASSMKRLPVSTAFRESMSWRSLEVPSSFYSRSEEGEPQRAGA